MAPFFQKAYREPETHTLLKPSPRGVLNTEGKILFSVIEKVIVKILNTVISYNIVHVMWGAMTH